MTLNEFLSKGEEISGKAGVMETLHGYFKTAGPRLHHSCELFGLFDNPRLGDVLEVGPFFGYTPFILRSSATSYSVLEGDDPAVYPLKPLYEEGRTTLKYVDLFEDFGPIATAKHHLDEPDSSYDTVLCWETMEHFGFNPVKYVRELFRIMKPGGRVYITVPNKRSIPSLVGLILGMDEEHVINSYFTFEDYECNGKKAFYGYHWREYSPHELQALFKKAGFEIVKTGGFTCFQGNKEMTLKRNAVRLLCETVTKVAPQYGTNAFLIAQKPV